MTEEKVKENRLRRSLQRRGLLLSKSRRRDPQALDFGGYMIVDPKASTVVAGGSPSAFSLTLEDVENWLTTY